jgi:phage baseplate assembly protein W
MDMDPVELTTERAVDARLDQAGQAIDRLLAQARGSSNAVSSQLARKVDALRAWEARVRARSREVREAEAAASAELRRELDALDAEIASVGEDLGSR